jgi:hypothetical protein
MNKQMTLDLKMIGKDNDKNKLSMISEGSSRTIETRIKFDKNLPKTKSKRRRIHIPG